MPTYPAPKDYVRPEGNILVLSCIDLRLTDELMYFLHYDDLRDKYDHTILAGASLITQIGDKKLNKLFTADAIANSSFKNWKDVWLEHLNIAIALHSVKAIYIVEHEDCGAYKHYLNQEEYKDRTAMDRIGCQKKFSSALINELKSMDKYKSLKFYSFYIDLKGNVSLLAPKK